MTELGWFAIIFLWLAVGWVAFAFFERRGFTNPKYITLSRAVYQLSEQAPLAIAGMYLVVGTFLGGLSVHFLWHWCPVGAISVGALQWH